LLNGYGMSSRTAAHGWVATGQTVPTTREWGIPLGSPSTNPLDADQLFSQLDGRSITTPQGAWFVEIQSIVDEACYRWIQLTLTGNPAYSLTFRLNPGDDADEAVRALSFWLISTRAQQVM
jgi:hypothetical protein